MNLTHTITDTTIIFDIPEISLIADSILRDILFWYADFWKTKIDLENYKIYNCENLKKSIFFDEYMDLVNKSKKLQNDYFWNFENKKDLEMLLPNSFLVKMNLILQKKDIKTALEIMFWANILEINYLAEKIFDNIKNEIEITIDFDKIKKEKNLKRELQNHIINSYWLEFDEEEMWLYQWIEDNEKVNIVFEWDFDNQICTSILYKNLNFEWFSIDECLDIIDDMDNSDKEVLMKLALGERQKFDKIPKVFWHSSIMFEIICDLKTIKDLQYLNNFSTLQYTSWVLWYDYLDNFEEKQLNNFKDDYDELMTKITFLSKKSATKNDEIFYYIWTLWHLSRITIELNPINLVWFFENKYENENTKKIVSECFKQFKKLSPIFSKFIR